MTEIKTYKHQSRRGWDSKEDQVCATNEQIQLGCLQRIADAIEAMATDPSELQRRLKGVEEGRDWWKGQADRRYRQNIALRGVITKLKKKLK